MKRAVIFTLAGLVLIAALVGLSHLLPQQTELAPLSVTVLRQGEGDALLLNCDGKTMVLGPGDAADYEDLADYMDEAGYESVELLAHGQTAATEDLEDVAELHATSDIRDLAGRELPLGAAKLRITLTEQGAHLTIRHGKNRLLFLLGSDAPTGSGQYDLLYAPEDQLTKQLLDRVRPSYAVIRPAEETLAETLEQHLQDREIEFLDTADQSVRILSDGTDLSIQPDFSIWHE